MADGDSVPHVLVHFITKQKKYAVPSTPFSVPSDVEVQQLNELINSLLQNEKDQLVDFDFLIDGQFLRVSLAKYIEEASLSTENVLDVEYVEAEPSPTPFESLLHDDWVSCVRANTSNRILSGCYDNTLKLWDTEGQCLATVSGHTGPVKCCAWIKAGCDSSFVSGSHDQTLMLWRWDREQGRVTCQCVCKGHAASVESVAVDPKGERFVSGSWDAMLKIWSAGAVTSRDDEGESGEHKRKKLRPDDKLATRVPLMTLSGHKEAVTACHWTSESELLSASWDHTIRFWDVQTGQQKSCLNGNKVFLDADYSHLNELIVTASSDRHVRVWDRRVKDLSVVKCTYTSHTGWVTGVAWSPDNDLQFVSGSYDMALKLWDTRSPKVPLYNMTGHDDRILCVDWTLPDLLISGGADNALKLFQR